MVSMTSPTDASSALPTVEVLVFEGVDELDAVGPFEVLSGAGFPTTTVGWPAGRDSIRGANGLTIGVDGPVGDQPGLLIVPGGGWLARSDVGVRPLVEGSELPQVITRLHANGTVVASVCTGAMLLAAAGLLKGRPAVTNRRALDDLRTTGADVRDDARVVDDGDVLTSGGVLAGIDLAIRIVERYLGEHAARRSTERLEYHRQGPLLVTGQVERSRTKLQD
jgi:transcriptional regulator GlxA family with amidase domain